MLSAWTVTLIMFGRVSWSFPVLFHAMACVMCKKMFWLGKRGLCIDRLQWRALGRRQFVIYYMIF